MNPRDRSDEELLDSLRRLCCAGRRITAHVVAHLVEVEDRRLHLKAACPSMFDFVVHRLGMSEGEAFLRLTAARLVRQFPDILAPLARGDLHLSALALLKNHLTEENHRELVAAACRKSKREVEELLARRFPRPDAPARLAKVPEPRSMPMPVVPEARQQPSPVSSGSPLRGPELGPVPMLVLQGPSVPAAPLPSPPASVPPSPQRATLDPLSKDRYRLQITIGAAARENIERARDLMRHRNPAGDLAMIVDEALALLVKELEKQRFAKTERPRRETRPAMPGHVTAATRREVFARDGEQCTYVDGEGKRCSARGFLELDHVHPRGLGGSGSASNIRVLCRGHNALQAEEVYGRAKTETAIRARRNGARGVDRAAAASPTEPEPSLTKRTPVAAKVVEASAASVTKRQAVQLGLGGPEMHRVVAAERSASLHVPDSDPIAPPPRGSSATPRDRLRPPR